MNMLPTMSPEWYRSVIHAIMTLDGMTNDRLSILLLGIPHHLRKQFHYYPTTVHMTVQVGHWLMVAEPLKLEGGLTFTEIILENAIFFRNGEEKVTLETLLSEYRNAMSRCS